MWVLIKFFILFVYHKTTAHGDSTSIKRGDIEKGRDKTPWESTIGASV